MARITQIDFSKLWALIDSIIMLTNHDHLAATHNRIWLLERNILALHLIGAHGCGKTTLLERTLHELGDELCMSIIVENGQTAPENQPLLRVSGSGCQTRANALGQGLRQLRPALDSLLLIESGSNPKRAASDMGEHGKVIMLSAAENEEQAIRYTGAIRVARLVVINKLDLLPRGSFDLERRTRSIRRMNPRAEILAISATRGDGIHTWYDWIRRQRSDGANPKTFTAWETY